MGYRLSEQHGFESKPLTLLQSRGKLGWWLNCGLSIVGLVICFIEMYIKCIGNVHKRRLFWKIFIKPTQRDERFQPSFSKVVSFPKSKRHPSKSQRFNRHTSSLHQKWCRPLFMADIFDEIETNFTHYFRHFCGNKSAKSLWISLFSACFAAGPTRCDVECKCEGAKCCIMCSSPPTTLSHD